MTNEYLHIPGWFNNDDGIVLKKLVRTVPDNGNILEVGSFLGRSTCCIAEEINTTIQIHCVDTHRYICREDENIKELARKFNCELDDIFPTIEKFKMYTSEYKDNIIMHLIDIIDFNTDMKFDLIFIDCLYNESYLKDIHKKFFEKLTPTGIICGHDCKEHEFIYKWKKLHELAEELNQDLILEREHSSVWQFKM